MINTEDERIKALQTEKETTLESQGTVYDNLINKNESLLEKQNSWQDTYQTEQNVLLDKSAALEKSELENKQKDTTEAYQKEAIASDYDYQKAINPYGVQAESQASAGVNNSGYAESTKMAAYNTSRMRTATARAAAVKANTELDVAMSEAQINYDSQKAALAYDLLKQKLANELAAFNTETTLVLDKLTTTNNTDDKYYNRYQDVYTQQKWEQEQATAQKQYEEQLSYQRERDLITDKQYEEQLAASRQAAAQEQANWEREYNLSAYKIYNDGPIDDLTGTTTIQTNYYSGPINPDVANGTFNTKDANGVKYQPDNFKGAKLKSSGKTVSQLFGKGNTGSTGANIDNQKVWKANDRYYIWDGSQNEYIDVTNSL